MIEIAQDEGQKGIFQKDIAENQQISLKYLDQIVSALKASGLIINVRGRKSGYKLTREPSEITILDIHNAFEADINIVECLNSAITCNLKKECKTFDFWNNLNTLIYNYFKTVTLIDLINGNIPTEVNLLLPCKRPD